ncbi:hypothetical protein OG579_16915 [Williamsia herbipolensis]|uniref:Uncharacterized protein n=1 Tax=Williamsia herbipolensis TaxID=1603258 RepID=A0AAU4K063_9NOCA|nr:hypothetical protein [Williamsia herbipolensis]
MTVDEAIAVLEAAAEPVKVPSVIRGSLPQLHRRALQAVDWAPGDELSTAIEVLRSARRL